LHALLNYFNNKNEYVVVYPIITFFLEQKMKY